MNWTPRNTFPTKDNNAITYLFSKPPRGVIIECGGVCTRGLFVFHEWGSNCQFLSKLAD